MNSDREPRERGKRRGIRPVPEGRPMNTRTVAVDLTTGETS
jgi:hypothetical protein